MFNKVIYKYNSIALPLRSALWFTICNFLNLGISILTTPIFTRLLSESEIGKVSVYNTWHSILAVIITLNLAYGIYEISLVKYEDDKDNMTSSLITVTILMCLFWFIVIVLFKKSIIKLLDLEYHYLLIMILDILFNSIITFWLTQNKFIYKYRICVIVSLGLTFFRAVLSVLFVTIFNYNKAFFRILGYSIPTIIVGIIILIYLLLKGKKWFKINYWKYAIAFNVVLIPHYLSGILLSSSDRIMISRLIGDDKAGIYSISYTCASLISILFTSINAVFTPYIYKSLKKKKYMELRDITNQIITGTIIVALMLILLAPEAIKVFAPPSYQEGIWLIPPVTMGIYMTFLYSLFSSIEFYYEKNKFITLATISGAVINLVLNLIFIPKFGYVAAAYTTLIGYIIMASAHYLFYKKIIEKPIYDIKSITKKVLFLILGGLWIMNIYEYFALRIGIVICLVLFAFTQIKKSKKIWTNS